MILKQPQMRIKYGENVKARAVKAESICQGCQHDGLAKIDERFEEWGNIRRGKPIGPFGIAGGFEFLLSDNAIDEEAGNAIYQHNNYGQSGNHGRSGERSNVRFAQDGKIFFK
jgi:hypothetical protein